MPRLGARDRVCLRPLQHVHRRLDHVLEHGHVRPQIEALEHHAKPRADPVDLMTVRRPRAVPRAGHADQLAADLDHAGIRRLEQVDAAQERALAGARAADHRDHVAVAGAERHALEHLERAETLVQILDDQRGRRPHRHVHPLIPVRAGWACSLLQPTAGESRLASPTGPDKWHGRHQGAERRASLTICQP
jgi:hypothetical protein